jgi:hypothetical protein
MTNYLNIARAQIKISVISARIVIDFHFVSWPRRFSSNLLATGTKVLGFKPGRERWIFKADSNP